MSVTKTKVTSEIKGRGHFAIIPNEIWATDIPFEAKVIWVYLMAQGESWDSSQNNLVRRFGMGKKTMSDLLNTLEKYGFIIMKKKGPKGTKFEMLPPSSWSCGYEYWFSPLPVLPVTGIPGDQTGSPQNQTGSPQNHIQEKEEEEIEEERRETHSLISKEIDSSPVNHIHPSADTSEITVEAILATWKPGPKTDYKDFDGLFCDLFTTIKHYGFSKDQLSTKKILKSVFGSTPPATIKWKVDKAETCIEEQRELVYAPDLKIQTGKVLSRSPVKIEDRETFNQFDWIMSKAKGETNG
jgi:hypothetical protein